MNMMNTEVRFKANGFNLADIQYMINHNGVERDTYKDEIRYKTPANCSSLLDYCTFDTGDVEENNRRTTLLDEYKNSNNVKEPAKIKAFSHDYVKFTCSKCGHTWTKRLDNRTGAGRGCPACNKNNTSSSEQYIYRMLANNFGEEDVTLHKKIYKYEFDVCVESLKLVIEFGNEYHHSLPGCAERDDYKRTLAKCHGYNIITIIQGTGSTGIYYDCLIDKHDSFILTARKYIKQYINDNYNVSIDIELSASDIEQCLRNTRLGVVTETDEKIIDLRKEGLSFNRINKILNVSSSASRYKKLVQLGYVLGA